MKENVNHSIYYFTGTGNSLRAAAVIAKSFGKTEIISMRMAPADVPAKNAGVIGFVFPVYHWTICEAIQDFIAKLEINPKAYIYAISVPSFINGFSFEALDKILREKGGALHYGKRVFSVANLCLVYPPMPFPKIRVPATERKLNRIAKELKKQKKNTYPKAGVLTRLLYSKVMPKYRDIQSEVDKGFMVSDTCVSCGLCAKVCPKKNITIESAKPAFLHKCSCCMACFSFCPQRAIQYRLPKEQHEKANKLLRYLMRMPEKRKCYRNPHISAKDLMLDRLYIE